jgi:hypothetical protein
LAPKLREVELLDFTLFILLAFLLVCLIFRHSHLSFQYWSWFDWLALYMTTKAKKEIANDVSGWVFRSITDNNAGTWLYPEKAVDVVRFLSFCHAFHFF